MFLNAFDISKQNVLRLLIGIVLLLLSIFSAQKNVINFYHTLQARDWQKVPCTILFVQTPIGILPGADNEKLYMHYGYHYNGISYQSESVRLLRPLTGTETELLDWVQQFEENIPACFVNPKNPEQALLTTDLYWSDLYCVFPVILFLIGIVFFTVGLSRTLRDMAKTRKALYVMESEL